MIAIAVIGFIFSPIAGAMAFLITYQEYSHHHLSQGALLRRSFEAAIVAAGFFALVFLGLSLTLPYVIGNNTG
jgi:hypothetical protein